MFGFDTSKTGVADNNTNEDSVPLSAPPIPSTQSDNTPAPVSNDEPSRTMPAVSTNGNQKTDKTDGDPDDILPGNRTKDDLSVIKQEALQKLSPLVEHLDQTPEEKFKTTMMMIQATDDHSLINSAFAAAKEIKDDKARAQALLDVVNEINYFTQQQN